MATLREIDRRRKSINNTAKVTHAMELVAAAKMRKAQEKALLSRPYTITLHQIITGLRGKAREKAHDLLLANRSSYRMIILLSSDRGLVGGMNLNLFREVSKFEIKTLKLVTVGKKATRFSARLGFPILASFHSEEIPFLELARTLSKLAINSFVSAEVASVHLLYPHFTSTVKQIPTIKRILPIQLEEEAETLNGRPASDTTIFEPSADRVLKGILPHHVLTDIYQSLLEAKASEHSARMVAMKNATDAASDLVDDLTLTYNQARQEAITKELLDIVTAQSAFE